MGDLNIKKRFNEDGSEKLSDLFDFTGPLITKNSADMMIEDYAHLLKKKMSITSNQDKDEEKKRIRQKRYRDRRRTKDKDNENPDANYSNFSELNASVKVTINKEGSREDLPIKEEFFFLF